jgi:hypothetical protein
MTQELDLIVSGGGTKFYYLIGIKKAIEMYSKKNILKINRYAGTSSGSMLITLMACNIDNSSIINVYKQLNKNNMELIKKGLEMLLPKNAHIICSNKVYISVTKLGFPFRNEIISKFSSRQDLIETILCSSSFPYFVNSEFYHKYKNKYYIDGFFSNNTPYFKDNLRKQLIINPFLIKYSTFHPFELEPNSHIKYISVGFKDFHKFLDGTKILPFEWYKKNKKKYFSIRKHITLLSYFINFKTVLLFIILLFILKI